MSTRSRSDSSGPWWRNPVIVMPAIATVAAAIITPVVAGRSDGDTPQTATATVLPTQATSAAVTTTSTAPDSALSASPSEPDASPAAVTTAEPAPAPPAPASDYLFDLEPASNTGFEVGSKTINGADYGRSVFHGLSPCNSGDGVGYSVQYYLGRKYSSFTAVAGLSDLDTPAPIPVQFRIDSDRAHRDFKAPLGTSFKVDFNVKGALYLRLSVYETNSAAPCNINGVAVWGDAQIRR